MIPTMPPPANILYAAMLASATFLFATGMRLGMLEKKWRQHIYEESTREADLHPQTSPQHHL